MIHSFYKDGVFTAVRRIAVFSTKYVKGVPSFNRRYSKGVPFLSKVEYIRVRGKTSGRSLPVWNFVESPSSAGQALKSTRFITWHQCVYQCCILTLRAGCCPFTSYAEPFHSLFVYRYMVLCRQSYHFFQGGKCKWGYLSCITPNFFSAISGHAKKKIAHQANPPSVAENPFANLFSDLLISDLVLLRLFGGPERQTSHFVGGYRVLYPFSEWRPFIRPQKHFTRACIEAGYYFKKKTLKTGRSRSRVATGRVVLSYFGWAALGISFTFKCSKSQQISWSSCEIAVRSCSSKFSGGGRGGF